VSISPSSPIPVESFLLKQHIAELRIGFIDTDGVHKLFDVMIHGCLWGWSDKDVHQFPAAR
jgi:hypothetical protein